MTRHLLMQLVALKVEPLLAEEAAKRKAHGKTAPGRTLGLKKGQALRAPKAAAEAAKLVGVSRSSVEHCVFKFLTSGS